MNNDKSPIDSFNVSLGKPLSAGSARPDRPGQPWNVLVCSDLGFASAEPRRAHVAEWNEFMAAANIVISGTLENASLPFPSPLFIEHTVRSLKDFSAEALKSSIPAFSAYGRLLDALASFLDGKARRDDVLSALDAAHLTKADKDRLSGLLGGPGSARTTGAAPSTPAVASILSMVDVSGSAPGLTAQPHAAVDGLLSALTEDAGSGADKAACRAFLDAGKKTLDAHIAALQDMPFFAAKKASWQNLFQCVKAVGRAKEIILSVFSASADARDEAADALDARYEGSIDSPDIIVWDFPGSFTNAEIARLTRLCGSADRFKSVVLVPLSSAERIFENIDARTDFAPLFEDIRFLPYKKFRSSLESRALCLCGPAMTIAEASPMPGKPPAALAANCCWPLVLRWIELTIHRRDPFAVDGPDNLRETVLPDNASFHPRIPEPVCEEAAAAAGITLLSGNPADALIDRLTTVIDREIAGSAYASLAFNLLVNRIARLSGRRIVETASSLSAEELAADIEEFLLRELTDCRVCTGTDQLSVKNEGNGSLAIGLDSGVLVGGHPARFSFSLDVR